MSFRTLNARRRRDENVLVLRADTLIDISTFYVGIRKFVTIIIVRYFLESY